MMTCSDPDTPNMRANTHSNQLTHVRNNESSTDRIKMTRQAPACDQMYGIPSLFPAKKNRFQDSTFAKSPRVSTFLCLRAPDSREADGMWGSPRKRSSATTGLVKVHMKLSLLKQSSVDTVNLHFSLALKSSNGGLQHAHSGFCFWW